MRALFLLAVLFMGVALPIKLFGQAPDRTAGIEEWLDSASANIGPAYATVAQASQVDQNANQSWLIRILAPENRGWGYYAQAWKNANDGAGLLETSVVKARKLGIDPAAFTSGVIQGFTFILLVIFLGIAVITGMNDVRNGGSFDMVALGMKFMLGVLLLSSPSTIYGFARVIQEGGKTVSVYALKLANKNEAMKKLLANPINIPSIEILRIRDNATKSAAVNYSAFAGKDPEGTMTKLLADSAANTPEFKKAIKERGYNSTEEVMTAFKGMDSGAQVGLITQMAQILISSDPAFKSEVDKLGSEYTKIYYEAQKANANSGSPGAYSDQLAAAKKTLETQVLNLARQTYRDKLMSWVGAQTDAAKEYLGNIFIQFIPDITNVITDWVNTTLMGLVTGALLWVVNIIFGAMLELSIPILCLTYPLWLVKTTSKAFLGAASSFFSFMLIPAVFVVSAMIVEGIFAAISKMLFPMVMGSATAAGGLSLTGVGLPLAGVLTSLSLGLLAFYFVAYVVALIAVAWKSPAIAKGIIEGGSVIGAFAGAVMTGVVAGALAGVGVAGTSLSAGLGTQGKGLGVGMGKDGLTMKEAANMKEYLRGKAPAVASGAPASASSASAHASTATRANALPSQSTSSLPTQAKLAKKQADVAKKAQDRKDKAEGKEVESPVVEADVFNTGSKNAGGKMKLPGQQKAAGGTKRADVGGPAMPKVASGGGGGGGGSVMVTGSPLPSSTLKTRAVSYARDMGTGGVILAKSVAANVMNGVISGASVEGMLKMQAFRAVTNKEPLPTIISPRKDSLVGDRA